jgi:phage shock protein A
MEPQRKTFWQRPEGVTGGILGAGLLVFGGWALYAALPILITLAANTLTLAAMLTALGALIYVVLDPKARNLVWYAYKSVMRWITGIFVRIDPISILKSYIDDLGENLKKMSKQIGILRGQIRQLSDLMASNAKEIENNMRLAEQAKKQGDQANMALSARKAARLQEANGKYDALLKKMDILYRVLTKMYENSELVLEDTRDQVLMQEQEYNAIKTSHSAMQSAMSVISGDPDKRAMYDQALEVLATDVGNKVGEMERFMDMSRGLMDSIDLQNGVFEEEGLKMIEEWEKKSLVMLDPHLKFGGDTLDLGSKPTAVPEKVAAEIEQKPKNEYEDLFGN